MAHTKPEMIEDLILELNAIRNLDGIKEKSVGIYYYKSIPFLHFHDKNGDLWADVKTPGGYKRVDITFRAKNSDKKRFLKSVYSAHATLAKGRVKL